VTVAVWPGWTGASLGCSRCDRTAAPIDRTAAIAIIGDLAYRIATLFDPDARSGDRLQCSLAVGECAAPVSEILTALDVHLRQMSALDGAPQGTARHPTVRGASQDVHASRCGLFESAARLAWTIQGMTEACWHRPSTIDGASAAEITWMTCTEHSIISKTPNGRGTQAPRLAGVFRMDETADELLIKETSRSRAKEADQQRPLVVHRQKSGSTPSSSLTTTRNPTSEQRSSTSRRHHLRRVTFVIVSYNSSDGREVSMFPDGGALPVWRDIPAEIVATSGLNPVSARSGSMAVREKS
jgi:hypothetical protein